MRGASTDIRSKRLKLIPVLGSLQNLFKRRSNGRTGSSAPELERIFEQAKGLEYNLSTASEEFEKRSLLILETLDKLRSMSGNLIEESETILSMSQSDNCPTRSFNRCLAPFLQFITESGTGIQSIKKGLAEDLSNIDQTLAHESQLDRTFSLLTYIRTLFAIEAAPLDQNVKTMFTSLVEEIDRLQTDVSKIFVEKFKKLREHKATIKQLILSLEKQASAQLITIQEDRKAMDDSLRRQEEVLDENIHSNAQLNHQSQNIGTAIGEAIIALQTQDSISQKIEHIYKITEEMRACFQAFENNPPPKEECEIYRFIEHASKIAVNQIRTIKSDLAKAESSIRSTFDRIAEAIKQTHLLYENKPSGQSCQQDELPELLQALQDAKSMIHICEQMSKDAFEKVSPIRGLASNVTEIISDLSAQLHLIGLNAEIHATHTGSSCGLETLSAKTSHISLETRELCQQASQSLETLVSDLNSNVIFAEELYTRASQQHSSILEAIPIQESRQATFLVEYSKSSQHASELVERLSKLILSDSLDLSLKDGLIEELEQLEQAQSAMSSEAKARADKIGIAVEIPELMKGLLDNYTMESEQSIHMDSLGIAHRPNASEFAAETSQSNDGIILFDEPPEAEFDIPERAPSDASHISTPGDIELF